MLMKSLFAIMVWPWNEKKTDLAAALAAQQRFVADASHELRTPLSTIRTNAEFLRERQDAAADDRAGAINDLVLEAERMSRLVDGLLVLARADAGVALERRPIDLRAIAADEVRRIRPPGPRPDQAQGVTLAAEGSALVSGDPDAVGRIVRVLLATAFRDARPSLPPSPSTSR